MAKIFVRERRDVGRRAGRPRFTIVGVQGTDLKFFKSNVRRAELDAVADAIGAEIVMLPRGEGEHNGDEGGARRRMDQPEPEG